MPIPIPGKNGIVREPLKRGNDPVDMTTETTQRGELVSVQVGRVQRMQMSDGPARDGRNAVWNSGIFKAAITGPARVSANGITGDEQYDLVNHGGPDNVVLAYNADHYPAWREQLNLSELPFGAFGENFTVRGFSDDVVCIGDIWEVGPQLRLQVTQARQPCFKLARRLERMEIIRLVKESSRGGWYMRVLQEGPAETGMGIKLTKRLYPDWPVSRAVQTMYARKKEKAAAQELAQLPELSARWKAELLNVG
jgi:MOSC domain-containing protein YiiM